MAEHLLLSLEELSSGSMKAVKLDRLNIVLFREQDGSVSALEDQCSHAQVKLSGGKFCDGVVTCPAHGATFQTSTGKQLKMPAVRPVRSFPVRIVEGKIMVSIPD